MRAFPTILMVLALTACANRSAPPGPAAPAAPVVTKASCTAAAAASSSATPTRAFMIACMRLTCQEGRVGSCYAVAREDDLREKDAEAFRRVSRQACDSEDEALDDAVHGEACVDFGFAERDPVQSANAFEKACTLKDRRGCTALGLAYREGKGRPRDEARARALLSKACKAGEAFACTALDDKP